MKIQARRSLIVISIYSQLFKSRVGLPDILFAIFSNSDIEAAWQTTFLFNNFFWKICYI